MECGVMDCGARFLTSDTPDALVVITFASARGLPVVATGAACPACGATPTEESIGPTLKPTVIDAEVRRVQRNEG